MCAIWGTYFIYLNKKSQNSYKNNKIQSPNASGSSSSCKGLLNINEHLLAYPFPFLSTIMILPFTIRQKLKFQKEHSYELCGSSPSVCRYCSLIMLLQEKERYTHLNAEFQRIARRDKKALLSEQRKEIEENNRMGKTRDFFRKIRDTKGPFHAKMDSIKEGKDLTEAEDIKKIWKECTELYKKIITIQIITMV